MSEFITTLYNFLNEILTSIASLDSDFSSFLTKEVFKDTSLIGLNITYNELFIYIGIIFLVIFFICFIFKFVSSLFRLFK